MVEFRRFARLRQGEGALAARQRTMIIHVHLVLLACLLWLLALMPALLWSPSSALLTVSTAAQFLVFGYGLSLYISWLTRRPSRRLRPLFWWVPQLAVITVCTYDPATNVMGPPV